jgi:hypothetical protein
MFSEGNAAHPVSRDSPLQIVIDIRRFFLFELLGRRDCTLQIVMAIWPTLKLKKSAPNGHTIIRRLSHPARSPSRIVCRGQEGHKGSKGTFRPDFQADNRPRIFLKPMSPQGTGRHTVKRVGEVVRHQHLVTQDQFTQVSNKVSDIPEENFTINIELFRQFSQVSN